MSAMSLSALSKRLEDASARRSALLAEYDSCSLAAVTADYKSDLQHLNSLISNAPPPTPLLNVLSSTTAATQPPTVYIRKLDADLTALRRSISRHSQALTMRGAASVAQRALQAGDLAAAVAAAAAHESARPEPQQAARVKENRGDDAAVADDAAIAAAATAVAAGAESEARQPTMEELVTKPVFMMHEQTLTALTATILSSYSSAIQSANLADISLYTPLLGRLGMASDAVGLYLKFSRNSLLDSFPAIPPTSPETPPPPLLPTLASIFNAASTHLRHHLPMVSSSLGVAGGDAALLQLVHLEVERLALPLLDEYRSSAFSQPRDRQQAPLSFRALKELSSGVTVDAMESDLNSSTSFPILSPTTLDKGLPATAAAAPERDDTRGGGPPAAQSLASKVPPVAMLDKALEDLSALLQYIEAYEGFIRHCGQEITRAREYRESEEGCEDGEGSPAEGSSGDGASGSSSAAPLPILPRLTKLGEVSLEVGSVYTRVEQVLLLSAYLRALSMPASYNSLESVVSTDALHSSLVEDLFYATGRSCERALRLGHVQTTCGALNHLSSSLSLVLLQIFFRRRVTNDPAPTAGLPSAGSSSGGGPSAAVLSIASLVASHLAGSSSASSSSSSSSSSSIGLSQPSSSAAGAKDAVASTVGFLASRMGGMLPPAAAAAAAATATAQREAAEKAAVLPPEVQLARALAVFNDLDLASQYIGKLSASLVQVALNVNGVTSPEQLDRQLFEALKSFSEVRDQLLSQCGDGFGIDYLIAALSPVIRSAVESSVGLDPNAATSGGVGAGISGAADALKQGAPWLSPWGHYYLHYNLSEAAVAALENSGTGGWPGALGAQLDAILAPMAKHLGDAIAVKVFLGVVREALKRVEIVLRKRQFTMLGALRFDGDVRTLVNYVRERVGERDEALASNRRELFDRCEGLERLVQISRIVNVTEIGEVRGVVRSSQGWKIKTMEVKGYLRLKVEAASWDLKEVDRMMS